jgi:hypothetical protein
LSNVVHPITSKLARGIVRVHFFLGQSAPAAAAATEVERTTAGTPSAVFGLIGVLNL